MYFDHRLDKASPNLLQYCLTGKHIPEVVLTVRKAGGSPLEYLRVTLEEVIITRVESFGYDTMRSPREKVGLSFSRVKMDYVLQNAEGGMAGTVSMGYDIKANAII
ncbi:type VI secretion system tube protein Hcp [Erwinia rhapontici]|uniref:Hcp family type VI secretion system effector n=1 Tax=Erwinia rhapontici TaxID=55212 RepID=UPI001D0DA494|nr:type VI secretion system tube protein Hcp [Erwinia rhapontici]UDQ82688.1 type VI secretion system tube protein Hcp [Erwinia rhapontici]